MTDLLARKPYAARDDDRFLGELRTLTRHHLDHCPAFRRIWPAWTDGETVEDFPFLHVGLFKHVSLRTDAEDVIHERVLQSSATTARQPSEIHLDRRSSGLQSASSLAILTDAVGADRRPLLVLDDVRSLRRRGTVSARVAAAMSLQPLATETHFLLREADDPASMKWDLLRDVLEKHDRILVYGFTWMLWLAWGEGRIPEETATTLRSRTVHFVHSGGWKKLEERRIERRQFDRALLEGVAGGSEVVDFYGLVEQVGVVYPICPEGYRHVPVWADVLVRDPFTLRAVVDQPGQIQLLNLLAWGSPYQSVLTEDLGEIVSGACPCGRSGRRFLLIGRVPKAEVRGCANI